MLNRLPADVRRTQLVEAGLAIAEHSGITAVTVRAVAEEACVSLGVVHYCFENKEALVAAMGEQLVHELATAMHAALAGALDNDAATNGRAEIGERALRGLLHRGVTAMWDVVEATADRQLLTYEITAYSLRSRAAGSAVAAGIGLSQYEVMDHEATQFLTAAAEHTEMIWTEPMQSLARSALAAIDGLVLRWLVDRDSLSVIYELDDLAARFSTKAVPN